MRGERKLGAAPERPCITWGQPQLCPPHHYTLLGLCPVHRSENPMDNLSFVSHSHPPRLFISHCISLFLRFHEPSAKWLHTINELGVTDPNLRLTPSRMFPLLSPPPFFSASIARSLSSKSQWQVGKSVGGRRGLSRECGSRTGAQLHLGRRLRPRSWAGRPCHGRGCGRI